MARVIINNNNYIIVVILINDTSYNLMTDKEKAQRYDELMKKQARQKAYDKMYLDRQRHNLAELTRIVKDNALEGQMVEFTKTIEDYM